MTNEPIEIRLNKEICSLFKLNGSSKFLGAFGWAHTDRSSKSSIAWLLQNDPSSPVKKSTFIIGVQYIDCGLTDRGNGHMENDGIVHDRSLKKALVAFHQQDPSMIKIFTSPSEGKIKAWEKSADILFLFSDFPGVTRLNTTKI